MRREGVIWVSNVWLIKVDKAEGVGGAGVKKGNAGIKP